MKKLFILGILTILCIGLLGTVFSEELTEGTLVDGQNLTVCTMDVMTCPSGIVVSRIPELNCEFAPCPQYDDPNGLIIENPAETTSLQTEDCMAKIEQINSQIKVISEKYSSEINTLKNNYELKLKEYKQTREEFISCLNLKTASRITANIAVSSANHQAVPQANAVSAANTLIASRLTIDSTAIMQETQSGENFIEINPEELTKNLIGLPEKTLENCKDEGLKAKDARSQVITAIDDVKKFRQTKNTDMQSIEELKNKRQEMLKKCNNGLRTQNNCKVPEELLLKEKQLREELINLQQNYLGESVSTEKDQEFIKKYQEIKKQHSMIEEKVNTFKKECEKPNQVNECQDREITNAIAEIKELLIKETNEKNIYELKTKLEYYYKKQERCNQTIILTTTATDPKELELRMYRDEIAKLKTEIQQKNKEIGNLKSSIESFKKEYKNASQEQKSEILANNANVIIEQTTTILNKRISELNEKISLIETNTNLDQEQKEKMIKSLNNRIAELQRNISDIDLAMTPEEIKKVINEARISDIRSKNQERITTLQKSSSQLKLIIGKHFVNNVDLKDKVDKLIIKTNTISEDATVEEIDELVGEYKEIKGELNE